MDKKDGFDAIEYPVDYSFKAVCSLQQSISINQIEDEIYSTIISQLGKVSVKNISSRKSKAGNYVSVTTMAKLDNRQQLEQVYKALSSLDIVKLTL